MSTIEPDATVPRRHAQAGDFDLIRRMGSGGFGVVFEARHRHTGLMYAVKRVELSVEDAERFRNEALYPARIASQSLHVLGVHSFFRDPHEDVFYLVSELVPHGDLRTFLDNQPKPVPITVALEVAIGIAKGLAAIHAQGIIHRDLKPANVLMDRKDESWVPKISDFGLARSTNSISIGEFASSGYAAPEQIDLLSDQPLGPESDLFSFGMILYELLTGQKATSARDIREYARWIGTSQIPAPPSAVRAELANWPQLDTLVASLLQFDRTKRANGASDLVKTLTRMLRSIDGGERLQIAKPAPDQVSVVDAPRTSPESPAPPTEATIGAWTRRRSLTFMAGVFLMTGLSMTLGLPWKDPASKLALPALPLPLFLLGGAGAPWYAQASWFVLPALFGLALALAVRLTVWRAAVVSVLSAAAYQLAIPAPFWISYAIGWMLKASGIGGSSSGSDSAAAAAAGGAGGAGGGEAVIASYLLAVGLMGALLVRTALAPWHRPSGRDLAMTAAAGALAAVGFVAASVFDGAQAAIGQQWSFGLCFATWQVVVGLVFADRMLFKPTSTDRHWSPKPLITVVPVVILMIAGGTWARTRPVPIAPGKTETNPKDSAAYVWIPPGEFQMGCSADDSECAQDEQPTRKVTFTKGFWLGHGEVRVRAWTSAPGKRALPPAASWGGLNYNPDWKREDMPIVNVTWQEASDYCSAIDGRLPTEAEWEYAARAGTASARYGRLFEVAWYADNSGQGSVNTTAMSDTALEGSLVSNGNSLQDVTSRSPNKWALFGMLGNVGEWVEDDYAETTYKLDSSPQTDPKPNYIGVSRVTKVVRGGSWGSRPREVRASARGKQDPEARSVFVGFRCVWNGPQAQK
jgi:formylglycine-generating enzyme required for sulfatase activity/serine/threonine protein kinase